MIFLVQSDLFLELCVLMARRERGEREKVERGSAERKQAEEEQDGICR
jgi:hypothetical protein